MLTSPIQFISSDNVDNNSCFPREQVSSMSYKNTPIGKETATLSFRNGHTIRSTRLPSGVVDQREIQIPQYKTKTERDDIVMDLRKQGFTQNEVATIMGISQATVSNIERNKSAIGH